MRYRPEIDGLRAIAIVPVIFFHLGSSILSGGFLGVDIFFVISGYLITSLLMEDLEKKRYSILAFYERRARRILPALIVVLFVSTLMALETLSDQRLNEYFKGLFSVVTFSSNILFWLMSGYFEPTAEHVYLLHTWSLSVEEQFYVLFPVFLLVVWRLGKEKASIITLLIALASLFSSVIWMKDYPNANFYLTFTRAWELMLGALVAFWVDKRGAENNNLLSFIGLFSILFSLFVYDKTIPTPSLYTILPTFGTALILLYANDKTVVAKLLSLRFFVYIGLISYSAYLWHQPILVYSRLQGFGEGFIEYKTSLSILLTLFVSIFSYKYIEQPFRSKNSVLSRRVVLSGSVFILLIVSFLSFYSAKNTMIFFSEEEKNVLSSIERSMSKQCHDPVDFCVSGDRNAIDVLLLGDSNAYHFSQSLSHISEKRGMKFVSLTLGGCLPLSEFYRSNEGSATNKECLSFNRKIKEYFLNGDFDGTVFVSAAWLLYLYGEDFYKNEARKAGINSVSRVQLSLNDDLLEGSEKQKEFFNYIERTVALLSSHSKHVFLVGPIPPALIDFDSKKRLMSENNGSSFIAFNRYASIFDKNLKRLSEKYGFSYLEPASKMCDEDVCNIMDGEKYIYGDPSHFSNHGQELIMRPLLEKAFLNINNYTNKG